MRNLQMSWDKKNGRLVCHWITAAGKRPDEAVQRCRGQYARAGRTV
jgi:hypothetical protein